MTRLTLAAFVAVLALAGCQVLTPVQARVFCDLGAGRLVPVDGPIDPISARYFCEQLVTDPNAVIVVTQ